MRPPRGPTELEEARAVPLGRLLRRGAWTITAMVGIVLAVNIATTAVNQVVFAPRLDEVTGHLGSTRDSHNDVVATQSAFKAWVVTGDVTHLERLGDDPAALTALVPDSIRERSDAGDATGRAYDRWLQRWVVPLANLDNIGEQPTSTLSELLRQERTLFDAYRTTQMGFVDELRAERDSLFVAERSVEVSAGVTSLLLVLVVLAVQRRQQARLARQLEAPIDDMLATMNRVRGGDLDARPSVEGSGELAALSIGLAETIEALQRAESEVRQRETALRTNIARQSTLLRMEQEIAGSDRPSDVAHVSVRAAAAVTGAPRVTLWEIDDAQISLRMAASFVAGSRGTAVSDDGASVALDVGHLGRALTEGQPISFTENGGRRWVWPLQTTSQSVGVLELVEGRVPMEDDLVDAVTTLSLHTASALVASRSHAENARFARQDGLTGLPNRRSFDADIEREVSHATRHGRPLSLIMIDLDHFKAVNDTHGHPYGDEVLRRTAGAVRSVLREEDVAYRMGGEELSVVCRETEVGAAALIAERIRAGIERMLSVEAGDRQVVTASLGVATAPVDRPTSDTLLAAADAALYEAKYSGRNQVVVSQS